MRSEGLRLEAYQCEAGKWTIGWGHTGDVKPGMRITQHEAEAILEFDLEVYEAAVERYCPGANSNQFGAMVSLCFNIGVHEFSQSTVVRRFNECKPQSAADAFLLFNKVRKNGQLIASEGLLKRRKAERALFLTLELQA